MDLTDDDRCPCGSRTYGACCAPLHRGDKQAPTAERVMRARYSAFVVGDEAYLRTTWHPSTCPTDPGVDPTTRWLGLIVHDAHGGGPLDQEGTVEFTADFEDGGRPGTIHEVSRFVRLDRRWVYLDA